MTLHAKRGDAARSAGSSSGLAVAVAVPAEQAGDESSGGIVALSPSAVANDPFRLSAELIERLRRGSPQANG